LWLAPDISVAVERAKAYVFLYRGLRVATTNARQNLFRLIDQVNTDHEPVFITGRKGSAVLISEDDWRAIEGTLYLNSIPGVSESVREGMKTPASDLDNTLEW
jgi:prevent-host-death family protein